MFFHWIWIILSDKYAEFCILKQKRNATEKDALNPLGWFEIRKIEIHPRARILPEPEIHPTCILPEPEYARPVFNPSARTDRSNPIYHICPSESILRNQRNSAKAINNFIVLI